MRFHPFWCALVLATSSACASAAPAPHANASSTAVPARYLYVWAGDKDGKSSDFLAVVDVNRDSKDFGQVVTTVPVGMSGSLPHHMEYSLPGQGQLLFANGHHHEATFLFDIEDARQPRLVRTLSPPSPYRFPHDFARLANGHVLVGYLRSEGPSPLPGDSTNPGGHGGIAELDGAGQMIRSASAADPGSRIPVRVYAFALRPDIDRMLTTSAPMMEDTSADVVQIWRMSDFKLLRTLPVPPALLPDGSVLPTGHGYPFEPRVMPDGSVLLNAYGCGFYRVTGLGSDAPDIRNVHTIDVRSAGKRMGACGIPIVVGHYWIMAVGRLSALVTLDIRDPAHPVETSRLHADSTFHPHWMARDPGSDRIIVGAENGGENRMLMAKVDSTTGRVSWDRSLHSADGALGISFVRATWPHGETGEAFGHAALFRP